VRQAERAVRWFQARYIAQADRKSSTAKSVRISPESTWEEVIGGGNAGAEAARLRLSDRADVPRVDQAISRVYRDKAPGGRFDGVGERVFERFGGWEGGLRLNSEPGFPCRSLLVYRDTGQRVRGSGGNDSGAAAGTGAGGVDERGGEPVFRIHFLRVSADGAGNVRHGHPRERMRAIAGEGLGLRQRVLHARDEQPWMGVRSPLDMG